MTLSDESFEPTPVMGEDSQPGFATDNLRSSGNPSTQVSSSSEPVVSMQEFYQLSQELLLVTLALTGIIFISVWIFYSLNIALNYLLGACTGVVYLRMLGKDVERLSRQKPSLSKSRFALFIGLIIVATQWHQLQILPIFLGFLTYKATLIVYMLRTLMPPDSQ